MQRDGEALAGGPGSNQRMGWKPPGALAVTCLLALVLLCAQFSMSPDHASASHNGLKFPFAAGTAWSVLQGYNTNPAQGGSHYNCDPNTLKDTVSQSVSCTAPWQYRYSIDLMEASGRTAGLDVLAPANGTVRWTQASTGGISINLGDGYAVALFHVILKPGIDTGTVLKQGQVIGTVAPANVANAGSTPHIHITLWESTDGGNWSRIARPFTGATAIDGVNFPDLGSGKLNQYQGTAVYSTNQPDSAAAGPLAPGLWSPASGATITDGASGVVFSWSSSSGATAFQVELDGTTYSPWVSNQKWTSGPLPDGTHTWRVRARNASAIGVWSGSRSFTVKNSGISPGQARISLNQSTGKVGEILTLSGAGFSAGEQVDLRWDSTSATPFKVITANGAGSFSTQFTVPDAKLGKHMVFAKGRNSGSEVASTYEVTPSLARNPVAGAPGTQVTVTVKGFGANEQVRITWKSASGPELGTVKTNGNGTGTLKISIPNGAPGWTDYVGIGQTSKAQAFGAINVLSKLYIYPAAGEVGATIHADAGGMPPGSAYTVKFNTIAGSGGTTVCSGRVSSDGIVRCTFRIPATGAGAYPITITAGSVSLTDTVEVLGPPAVSVSPANAAIGTNITVTAGGFRAGEKVIVSWGFVDSWRTETADSQGAVRILATVPEAGSGSQTIRARGEASNRSAAASYTVSAAAEPGATSMISPGVYSVFATREGLVGGTTSSGHVIVPEDYFVALPACTPSNCKGNFTPGNMTQCGDKCYVKVTNPNTNVCRVEPILDTGPWFTVDDWWNPTSSRYLNSLPSNPNTLAQGYTGADAARNKLDVGYGKGPNGYGQDNTGTIPGRPWREVGNNAAIDLADGTWHALAPQSNNVGGTIIAAMLWQTGEDPASAAANCGHPLNQKGGTPATFEPGTSNPSFSGQKLPIVANSDYRGTTLAAYTYDGNNSSNWTSASNTPTTASFTLDLGSDRSISGVKWLFAYQGYADSFDVSVKTTSGSVKQLGQFGGGASRQWWGVAAGTGVSGRYVTFTFTNPNRDYVLGSVGEVQVWGTTVQVAPGTSNPSFGGNPLPIFSSSDSPSTGLAFRLYDGNQSSNWTSPKNTPNSASFTLDLGSDRPITGVKWLFAYGGYADSFTVSVKTSSGSVRQLGQFGGGASRQWWGVAAGSGVTGRYVTFTFSNPNRDYVLGSVGEVQIWGTVPNSGAGQRNPGFSGGILRITNSFDTPKTWGTYKVHDGNPMSNWISARNSPSQASVTLDVGSYTQISGIRWQFAFYGYADRFTVSFQTQDGSTVVLGPFHNGDSSVWYGSGLPSLPRVRFVTFSFYNPNGDSLVGSLGEAEIWGPRGMTASAFSATEVTPAAVASPVAEASPVAATPVAEASPVPDQGKDVEASPVAVGSPSPELDEPEASPAPVPDDSDVPLDAATPVPDELSEPVASPSIEQDAVPEASPSAAPDTMPEASPSIEQGVPSDDVVEPGNGTPEPIEPMPTLVATETPELPEPEPTQAVTAIGYIAHTDGDGANCRVGPGTGFDIVSWLAEGSEIRLVGEPVAGWQEVICQGEAGYVSAEFISFDAPVEPSPTATATAEASATGDVAAEPTSSATDEANTIDLPTITVTPDFAVEPTATELVIPTETQEPTLAPTPTAEPTLEPVPTQEPVLIEREIVIPVAADTSVSGMNPDATQLPDEIYSLAAGGPEEDLAVMTFDVNGIGDATVVDARLVVMGSGDSAGAGGQVLAGPGLWFDESTTTWQAVANAAPWQFGWIDWIEPGVESSQNVTEVVTADGVVSFVLVGTPEQAIAIASREQGSPAYLVITVTEYVTP